MKTQPFLFDANIFDEDLPLPEEDIEKLPTFTNEEMENAKIDAFEKGKEAGFSQSQESITQNMMVLLEKIEKDIDILFSSEDKRLRKYEQNATYLATEIFTKAFPVYMKTHGMEELQRAVSEALSHHMIPKEIHINVNEAIIEPFKKLIKEHTASLQKQVTFETDPSLPEYACRISWPDGGLICDRNTLAEKIFNILNQSLAQRGISLHDGEHGKKEDNVPCDNDAGEDKRNMCNNMPEETNTSGES